MISLGLVGFAVLLFLIPAIPGWHGDPDRHDLVIISVPVSIVLLLVYVAVTLYSLRRHRQQHISDESPEMAGWSFTTSLLVLGGATVITALVAEILVGTLEAFAEKAHLSDFFVAAVIVAIVGNAAEHGGAIVIAHRGKLRLATEIAVSSSAQVALFVTPAVALLSWVVTPALPLSFRPIELAAMGGSAVLVGFMLADGRGRRWEGFALVAIYAGVALAFLAAGDR
jgi:Ca2+:H+ antiporter